VKEHWKGYLILNRTAGLEAATSAFKQLHYRKVGNTKFQLGWAILEL
jgi:hypothetical protein